MDIKMLMNYTTEDGEGQRVPKDGVMLTMLDPAGRTNQQVPIETVAVVDGCVVIGLLNVEDATWYDAATFDEDIKLWLEAVDNL